ALSAGNRHGIEFLEPPDIQDNDILFSFENAFDLFGGKRWRVPDGFDQLTKGFGWHVYIDIYLAQFGISGQPSVDYGDILIPQRLDPRGGGFRITFAIVDDR